MNVFIFSILSDTGRQHETKAEHKNEILSNNC